MTSSGCGGSTVTMALSSASATSSLINRPLSNSSPSVTAFSSCNFINHTKRKGWIISCEIAVKSNNSATTSVEFESNNPSVSAASNDSDVDSEAGSKVGSRVKVKVPLKVYHVPKVPEVDLTGMEGILKQYVALWKGKKISANLPYKVEFLTEIQGRGKVKFVAHLKEDEFDYLD